MRTAFIALALVLAPRPVTAEERQPIRVGSNVQESKLVERVSPVYPPEAKAQRVAGQVILQATIGEAGQVVDVTVLRGHPLLDSAAVDAVRRWRYEPTYLNGQPVSVIASVSVFFPEPLSITVAADGTVAEGGTGASGAALDSKISEAVRVIVVAAADVPLPKLAREVERLRGLGVGDVQLRGGFAYHEGAVFYDPVPSGVRPPDLALDEERLRALARRELEERGARAVGHFRYELFVNEVGEVVGVRSTGPLKLAAVEDELRRTRVVTPGRRGPDPVPTVLSVLVSPE